uniref:PRA1 family protein n=1 Tax=Panagrellus redivivus TaxID=6233 RepID=A0A7E4V1Y8_PANRE
MSFNRSKIAAPEATTADENYHWNNDIEFAPLRSIDEFLLNKDRYELAPFNDFPKWNNRITSNLLYFQSNYFVSILAFGLFASFIHAKAMAIGFVVLGLIVGLGLFLRSRDPRVIVIRQEHPYAFLAVIVVVLYSFITYLQFVVITLFSIAFPTLLVLIHASLRLRNLMNKVNNSVYKRVSSADKTVMAAIIKVLSRDLRA